MGFIVVVLGSTGSIGTNALNLAERFNIEIEAISCGQNVELLNTQIKKFQPKFVCVADEKKVKFVKHKNIFVGENGLVDMIKASNSKLVLNSLVGFIGLKPSLITQSLGKKLALANKESLVVGGKFLNTSTINAIDSEHFGLKFILENKTPVKELIITASGGAFFKTTLSTLKNATPKDALKHPNWSMGAKITIDSATMANKLFEIIEAYWLYGISEISALIEPTSIIHALVSFNDGSTLAHISETDMSLAIAHGILPKEALKKLSNPIIKHVNLQQIKALKFHTISLKKYPIFRLKDDFLSNPDLGVIINAANEVGVFKFLQKECDFLDISQLVLAAVKRFRNIKILSQDDIFEANLQVRAWANKEIK